MDIDKLNKRLIKHWDNYSKIKSDKFQDFLYPLPFTKELNTDAEFVCIGLNPSFRADSWYNVLEKNVSPSNIFKPIKESAIRQGYKIPPSEKDKEKIKEDIKNAKVESATNYFKYQSIKDFNRKLKTIKDLEVNSFKKHNYFEKFRVLSKSLYGSEEQFIHLDLFNYKVTSSKKLLELLKDKPEFFLFQLNLFKEVFDSLSSPKITLIANADASRICKRLFSDDIDIEFLRNYPKGFEHEEYTGSAMGIYNDEYGFYRFPNEKSTFFFSGMISQGMLDLDSFDRLKMTLERFKDSDEYSK